MKRSTTKAGDLITTTKAAELLSKPARTVRQWVNSKKLASIRIGKNDFVSRRAVLRLKQKQESDAK